VKLQVEITVFMFCGMIKAEMSKMQAAKLFCIIRMSTESAIMIGHFASKIQLL
jgi:hypothetical protein